jgi:predicted ATPase/DNA-binding CsgD family transcriptional regulator
MSTSSDADVRQVNGLPASLTRFIGRQSEVAEIGELLSEFRLVTVIGPGGVGKTRLACEVAREIAPRFADGVWLVELSSLQDPALVPTVVAAALGIRQEQTAPIVESLIAVLARQQLLIVLDNCEHVLGPVAELCRAVLPAADDVRILATSRERIGQPGEARFRLKPLDLADSGDGPEGPSEAVALFTDRARQADPRFVLDADSGAVARQIVAKLDGMPLAIELAAARVEALGLGQLLERLDNSIALLDGGDRLAPDRLRSLAATANWSYQLLSGAEQRVFRALSVFPGPFTLDAAEAVAGDDAGPVVMRLVDCSLLSPPAAGPDGRSRYAMLQALRAFATAQLAAAGESDAAALAYLRYATQLVATAAAGLESSTGELAALRWLDAEDATVHQALTWAVDHEPASALALATHLVRWWSQRGRGATGYDLLTAAAAQADPGRPDWCVAQVKLGELSTKGSPDYNRPLGHFIAACDGLPANEPSRWLARALAGVARCHANLGQLDSAAAAGQQALLVARSTGDREAEMLALYALAATADYSGDVELALSSMREAVAIDPAEVCGETARRCIAGLTIVLLDGGDLDGALEQGSRGLELARQSGDEKDQADFLSLLAYGHLRANRLPEASKLLHDAIELASRTGLQLGQIGALDSCGFLCATGQRFEEAITIWAAHAEFLSAFGLLDIPSDAASRQALITAARNALGGPAARLAEQRGAAMTLATASEYALMLTADAPPVRQEQAVARLAGLSPREQELMTLVARGNTDTQIASQLFISVRTVRSHLDRIRDKTGCRRRVDLTRMALQVGLV